MNTFHFKGNAPEFDLFNFGSLYPAIERFSTCNKFLSDYANLTSMNISCSVFHNFPPTHICHATLPFYYFFL